MSLFLPGVFLLTLMFMPALNSQTSSQDNFAAHRWKHRLLLILLPKGVDSQRQNWETKLLPKKLEILERDLKVFLIQDDGAMEELWSPSAPPSQAKLKAEWKNPLSTESILLIGKDGGLKHRQDQLDLKEIFQKIDAMPMRQEEMRSSQPKAHPFGPPPGGPKPY